MARNVASAGNQTGNRLTVPADAGRIIIENAAVIACPVLWTDSFIKFCSERGLRINRERLCRLERLGLFSPVFRARAPDKEAPPFYIPIRNGNNWFAKSWAWDTTCLPCSYAVPDRRDETQGAYYSIFQIDYLRSVLMSLTLDLHLDSFLEDPGGPAIDWQENGERWMQYADVTAQALRDSDHRRAVALLCQHISNRYYPKTQTDQRTITIKNGHSSDRLISIMGHNWDWHDEVRRWNPKLVESLYDLTSKKLRSAYEDLAVSQAMCDPLEKWYQLTQFVELSERKKLKGDALLAETLRAGAHMLRLLHADLYGEELADPNEVAGVIYDHFPELEIRRDVRRYLEFVANRFGVNPQPKLSLIVEGQSEEAAIKRIFHEYFGAHPGVYAIEIIVLAGVDNATGSKKEDRFRAILRLVDYLHYHQTITFLVLDNENYAARLKQEARKAKSIHSKKRFVTRPEYIRIWKRSFEFDNFSCTEIAAAMNAMAEGRAVFSVKEVRDCTKSTNPGSCLEKLYHQKTNYDLPKVKLNDYLAGSMLSPQTKRRPESRPIVKALERMGRLAARNPFPTTQRVWEINQASKHLGKIRKPGRSKKSGARP